MPRNGRSRFGNQVGPDVRAVNLRFPNFGKEAIIFFISDFLGIDAETFRTALIDLASELVPAGEAFHLFLIASCDIVLGIVAEEEVGSGRIGDVQRIGAA